MSINAQYRRITLGELAAFKSDPDSIETFFGLDKFNEADDETDWDEYFENEDSPVDDPDRLLNISNEWQAIHYIVTGEFAFEGKSQVRPPLCNVVMGGRYLGNIDVGYGPPRYLEPDEVRDAASALARLDMHLVRNRVNAIEFNRLRIYPGDWRQEDAAMILNTLHGIISFFRNAAEEGDAMLLWSS